MMENSTNPVFSENNAVICNDDEDCIVHCNDANPCKSADIECPSNANCHVHCYSGSSDSVCQGINVQCPTHGECQILCDGSDACKAATFDARSATYFFLQCTTASSHTCTHLKIYFPENVNGEKRAYISAADNSFSNGGADRMQFYAVHGWLDVDVSDSSHEMHDGRMFCGEDYTGSCILDNYSWCCLNDNDVCNNPDDTTLATSVNNNSIMEDTEANPEFTTNDVSFAHMTETVLLCIIIFIFLFCLCFIGCIFFYFVTRYITKMQQQFAASMRDLIEHTSVEHSRLPQLEVHTASVNGLQLSIVPSGSGSVKQFASPQTVCTPESLDSVVSPVASEASHDKYLPLSIPMKAPAIMSAAHYEPARSNSSLHAVSASAMSPQEGVPRWHSPPAAVALRSNSDARAFDVAVHQPPSTDNVRDVDAVVASRQIPPNVPMIVYRAPEPKHMMAMMGIMDHSEPPSLNYFIDNCNHNNEAMPPVPLPRESSTFTTQSRISVPSIPVAKPQIFEPEFSRQQMNDTQSSTD